MLTARQSQYMKGAAGDPLPAVWDALERKGTRFLRGQLALICAAPGCGKSAMVLAYAVKSRVPCLYFSADSDAFNQLSRMLSIELGWPLSKSTEVVRDLRLGDELDHIPVRFNYEASPTLKTIEVEMEAYHELNGEYPELVVIDNITNVLTKASEEDPFAGLEALLDFLHELARDSGSCVVGLHHVQGIYNNGNVPIPLSGVKGQITRVPELVLTLHRRDEFGKTSICISTVKNRSGKADPSGMDYVSLAFDGPSMKMEDQR